MMAPPVLSVTHLSKAYGPVDVLHDVSFEVTRGEVVAIIGPSGCGKSTLLRCLTWLEQPQKGEIRLSGQSFGAVGEGLSRKTQSRRQIDKARPKLGMVFQQLNLWPHLSALGNVERPQRVVLGRSPEEARNRAMNLLQSLGLADRADHLPATLSGGQRQRVAIARALAMDPELLLFDEPTAALDPELVGEVHTMLRNLAQQGATMVIVTHEIGFARNVADRAIFLDHGRIIADGPAAQVFGGASDPRLAAFLSFSHR